MRVRSKEGVERQGFAAQGTRLRISCGDQLGVWLYGGDTSVGMSRLALRDRHRFFFDPRLKWRRHVRWYAKHHRVLLLTFALIDVSFEFASFGILWVHPSLGLENGVCVLGSVWRCDGVGPSTLEQSAAARAVPNRLIFPVFDVPLSCVVKYCG